MRVATRRARAPALLLAATLGIGVLSGCERDEPTGPRPEQINAVFGWDPGPMYNCLIGKQTLGWQGWLFPVSDTACGVTWTVNTPWFGNNPTLESAMFFPYQPEAGMTLNTRWRLGTYNDIAKDKLTFTFNKSVQAFALDLDGIDMAGHYMIAYDSAGAQLGRADFVWDVDRRDAREIVAQGISRVEYYFPLGNCGPTSCTQLDPTMHQAAFSYTPPPPPHRALWRTR
jgi:hypothetical protein